MKRFFCTVCQRVKRVRSLPSIIDNPTSVSLQDRTGQCDYHTSGRPSYARVKPAHSNIKSTTASVVKSTTAKAS